MARGWSDRRTTKRDLKEKSKRGRYKRGGRFRTMSFASEVAEETKENKKDKKRRR